MDDYGYVVGYESPATDAVAVAWGSMLGGVGFLLLSLIVWLLIKSRLSAWRRSQYQRQIIYSIRLPKEAAPEDVQLKGKELVQANIAKAEAVLAAIGGLRAERGWHAWLMGRSDHFALEIVGHQGKINFYIVTPAYAGDYLEKQIHAYFPDAEVVPVKDYNIFHQRGYVGGGFLTLLKPLAFPIKTYRYEDSDGLSSVFSAMSKLNDGESMAVQLLTRSAKRHWHDQVSSLVRRAYERQSLKAALGGHWLLSGLGRLIDLFFKPSEAAAPTAMTLTDMEKQIIKNIEEKNAKAGLDVNLRLVVSGPAAQAAELHLAELAGAFSQFNYFEYGNGFANRLARGKQDETINDFIHRRFNRRQAMLLNSEELATIFHFPLPTIDNPNINWLPAKTSAAPIVLPQEGLVLGYNEFRGQTRDIRIKAADRLRHTYIVGKSGVGKSVLLANLAIQDVMNGEGLCVLDPHGDLVEDILARVPDNRINDVVVFAPADVERPLGLNLLEYDRRYPEQKTFVINEMIGIFDKLYDLKSTGGPIFEQYMRNAMLLVMSDHDHPATLLDIPRVLSDADFRRAKLADCDDPMVVNFWIKEAQAAGGDAALANVVPYVTSKLTSFISNDIMRPIIGQANSSFNLRDLMDEKKILLVSLPKGLVGELNSYLLGMIIVGKILMAALSRADSPQALRSPFYLYIDEFQNFTTDSIKQVLSEARKYGLGLILAHQYIGQLVRQGDSSIKDAVFGNVGTTVSFKVGPDDAEFLEKLFKPEFSAVDLVNVDKYTAFVRLLVDNMNTNPFTMKTPWPLFGEVAAGRSEKIKQYSRLRYGVDRQLIEAEIRLRLNNF